MNKKDELQIKIEKLEQLKREKQSEVNNIDHDISLSKKELGEHLISQLGIVRGAKVIVRLGFWELLTDACFLFISVYNYAI